MVKKEQQKQEPQPQQPQQTQQPQAESKTKEQLDIEAISSQGELVMTAALNMTDKMAPRVAQVYHKVFNELKAAGFSNEEALEIVKTRNIGL